MDMDVFADNQLVIKAGGTICKKPLSMVVMSASWVQMGGLSSGTMNGLTIV